MNKKTIIILVLVILLLVVSAFFIFQFLFNNDDDMTDIDPPTTTTEQTDNFGEDNTEGENTDGTEGTEGTDGTEGENTAGEGMGTLIITTSDDYAIPTVGSTFKVTNLETMEETTISVEQDGIAQKELPYGTYQVEEITPPEGYEKNEEQMTAYLDDFNPEFRIPYSYHAAGELGANTGEEAGTENPEGGTELVDNTPTEDPFAPTDEAQEDPYQPPENPEVDPYAPTEEVQEDPYAPPVETDPYQPSTESESYQTENTTDFSSGGGSGDYADKTENPKTADSTDGIKLGILLSGSICAMLILVYRKIKAQGFY